jgi:hypothetical protein
VNTGRLRLSLADRIDLFWLHVEQQGECWVWTASKTKKGYGQVSAFGKMWRAHTFAWRVIYGEEIPPGHQLRHSCDHRPCVRRAHLLTGTPAQNSADMVSRGREPHVRGMAHGATRYAPDVLDVVRRLAIRGWSTRAIAAALGGLSKSHAHAVVSGKERLHG